MQNIVNTVHVWFDMERHIVGKRVLLTCYLDVFLLLQAVRLAQKVLCTVTMVELASGQALSLHAGESWKDTFMYDCPFIL